jgi:hypothetical protein
LITSGEHYGSVINTDFDYVKYLDELASEKLNHTRIFVGPYREVPGSFGITGNTLAPKAESYICAWARSDEGGARDGLNKFDLDKWDERFFTRLKDFCTEAGERGVVIEVCLFCPYYWDQLWYYSPFYKDNNINGVGDVGYKDVYKMANTEIVRRQVEFTRKIVTELNGFDNLYYEVCNEPWVHEVEQAWQHHIVNTIADTEEGLEQKHLVSLNVSNGYLTVEKPHPDVSIFNFHYDSPPVAVGVNYGLNKAIGFNETGFAGHADETYRMQAWKFMLAGGALFNNLDYSFAVGHEGGTYKYPDQTPGGGSKALRRQLKVLAEFMGTFDFVHSRPANSILKGVHTLNGAGYALAVEDKTYAVYAFGSLEMFIYLEVPQGRYDVRWVDPRGEGADQTEQVSHDGGILKLVARPFKGEVAVRLDRVD